MVMYEREVAFVREVMAGFAPLITEHVKWNAPAWRYNGPLPEGIDAKTYPRDVCWF